MDQSIHVRQARYSLEAENDDDDDDDDSDDEEQSTYSFRSKAQGE
jgi:hypothetical protein